ncbi:MAG: hypothetical protein J0M05_02930, partial [Candidatus Kapabacteria bacterium]|nr:hypothetical protein [Candidatus Kapabacteria bacterium]
MKTFLHTFIVCFAFLAYQSLNAQNKGWVWQNPQPQGNTITSLAIKPNGLAIACAEAGGIIASADQGNVWTGRLTATSQDLFAVSFSSNNNGWAVGTNGTIVKTSDGGIRWEVQKSNVTAGLQSVYAVNDSI